jgi:hypothetical protein
MKTGRNDPCPCGSGDKFKKCCEGKPDASQKVRSRGLYALLLVVLIIVVTGVVIELRSDRGATERADQVWSAEHGHYHDTSHGH